MSIFRLSATPLAAFVASIGFAWVYVGMYATACASPISFAYVASSGCNYQQPHNPALSADGRYLYVPEVRRHRIVVLDAESLSYVGAFGHNELRYPHDASLGPDGLIYVADSGNDRVVAYAVEGKEARMVTALSGGFENPEGVLAHPDGRIFVSGEDSGTVVVFKDGAVIQSFSGLERPHGIGLADDGGVWVAEAGSHQLVHLDTTLERTQRRLDTQLSGPRYLDLAPDGRLFVAEKERHGISVISKTGALITHLGKGQADMGEGAFNGPEGVVLALPSMWVADTSNGRIVRYQISAGEN